MTGRTPVNLIEDLKAPETFASIGLIFATLNPVTSIRLGSTRRAHRTVGPAQNL